MAAVSAALTGAALGSVAVQQTAATQVRISIGGHSGCSLRNSRTAPCRSPNFANSVSYAPLRIEAREPTRRETVKVRHRRIRKKLNGTPERPRLAVFRSNKHLYAQVIDDTKQQTLAASSTLKKVLREELETTAGPTIESAKRVGEEIAKVCLEKGITKVAFDRGGFVYHGRIQALAEAAREGGLDF